MRYARPRPQSSAARYARPPRPRYNPGIRAGLVMAKDMDYAGLGDAETIFMEEGVALAPMSAAGRETMSAYGGSITILPTAHLKDVEDHTLTGLVAPGGQESGEAGNAAGFDKLMNTAKAEHLPIMAFGDAVPRALESLGYEQPQGDLPPGILVLDGVRILETTEDVRDAVTAFKHAA